MAAKKDKKIKVQKGDLTLEVYEKAFKSLYEPDGFHRVKEESKKK